MCNPQVNYRVRKILSLVLTVNLIKPANNFPWPPPSVLQHPSSGLVLPVVDFATSHTIRCTQLVQRPLPTNNTQETERRGFRNRYPGNRAAVDGTVPSYLFAGSLNIVRIYSSVVLDVSVQDFQLEAFLFPPTRPTRAAHFFLHLIALTMSVD